MRNVVRYSEAFKLRLVEDVAGGKYKSLDEAGRRNGICGSATLARWIKQYGREDILPKRIKVETTEETDGMKAARRRIREMETVSYAGAETGSGRRSHRPGPVFRGVAGERAAA
jgi:transposase-like protein